MNHSSRPPRGIALIFVLWLLVLLGVAASEIARRAVSEGDLVATVRARSAGRYAAESGILLTTWRLEQLLDSARAPAERARAFRRELSQSPLPEISLRSGVGSTEARFSVAVVDLNSQLDLNRCDTLTLQSLFSQFVPLGRATAIVRALKREPVRRVEELARLPNAGDELAVAVAPYVTVWSDGLINVNTAPAEVLAAVPGIGQSQAAAIVSRRASGQVFESPDAVRRRGVPGPVLTIAPSRVMLVSRGWQTGHPLTHEIQAVYVVMGQTLVLENWEEHDR